MVHACYVIIVCRRLDDGRLRFSNPGCRAYDVVLTGTGRWNDGDGECPCCCCAYAGFPLRDDRTVAYDGDCAGGCDDLAPPLATMAASPLGLRLCEFDGESRPCALPLSDPEPDPCPLVGDALCDRWPCPRCPNCCIMKGAAGGSKGMS